MPAQPAPAAARPQRVHLPGDRAVAVGAVLFALGLVATLVTVVPLFLGSDPFPTAVYLLSALAPLGLATALGGLLVAARARRRTTGTATRRRRDR